MVFAMPGLLWGQTAIDSTAAMIMPSRTASVEVTASIDTTTIIVGEQKNLYIIVTRLDGATMPNIVFPNPKALTSGAIEAYESHCDTTMDAGGAIEQIRQTVTITSFDAGRHRIEKIALIVEEGGMQNLIAPADSLFVNVAYAADADTTKCEVMNDASFLKEPYTFWETARWGLLFVVVALLVFMTVWIIKRRKENKPIMVLPHQKPVPADRRALNELEALRRKELWQKGRVKKYYTDMTDIVRRFLRNMYGINASEMTTRQTLKAFHGIADWSEDSESLLRHLLQQADMVKFAKSQPESYEHDKAMQNAIDFVRTVAETHKANEEPSDK